jgi:hypothetical protein
VNYLRSLLCLFVVSCVPSIAAADESLSWAKRRVEVGVIKELAQKDSKRSKFSRSRPPPAERRARIVASSPSYDKGGLAFAPYAVDARWGDEWQNGDVVGCVYKDSGNLYVKLGDEFYPVSILLGEGGEKVSGVCEAAPPPKA